MWHERLIDVAGWCNSMIKLAAIWVTKNVVCFTWVTWRYDLWNMKHARRNGENIIFLKSWTGDRSGGMFMWHV